MTTPTNLNEPQPATHEWPADADPFVTGSMDALRRAGKRARELARQTGTDLVVMRGGRIVRVSPKDQKERQAA